MSFDKESVQAAQAAFGLAAILVHKEPDEAWVRMCIDEDLFCASPFGAEDAAVEKGLELLASWCDAAREDVPERTKDIQRDWLRLFVGVGAPQAPVWEAFYTEPNATMVGRSTLDVRAAYREWGLEYERKNQEPDDALGLMLAFCSHLLGCEAQALDDGCAAAAEKAPAALEAFMVKHMLPWTSAWRFLVAEHAKTDYYRGVGELTFGLMRAYAQRFGVTCNEEDGTFSYTSRA